MYVFCPFFLGSADNVDSDEKRQSGLSGMLAAFPPPGLATPTRDMSPAPRPTSQWPVRSPLNNEPSTAGLKPEQKKKGRRCCGLPLWGFFLVLLIVLMIVAAAVLVPLFLLVFNKKTPAAPVLSPLESCAQNAATACQNGGMTFLSSGSCACICINGFTGTTCTTASATGCTVATLSTDLSNVTLGDSIPRLVEAAQTNFSIPLFSTTILSRFSAANLSCLSENALVTFSGNSKRVGAANAIVVDQTSETATVGVATVNGIMFDPASSPIPKTTYSRPTAAPASTTAPTATSTPASSSSKTTTTASVASPTPSAGATFAVTEQVLDFARVAVLYVLQQESLGSASVAQVNLQRFFSSGDARTEEGARNVGLGGANMVDLVGLRVSVGNGTVGGGAGGESGSVRRRWM